MDNSKNNFAYNLPTADMSKVIFWIEHITDPKLPRTIS